MTVYNVIHGTEFWLALAIWGTGAMFGIVASWIAIEISDRREEARRRESAASDLDHPDSGGGGAAPRRDPDGGGG